MKKILLLFGALLLSAGVASAQTTIVSGTVIDPNGWPYSGGVGPTSGRITGKILPPGVTSIRVGGKFFSTTFNAGLDVNGHFSIALADNNLATPANTQWQFTVCGYGALPPLGTGGQCFTAPPITITGAAQDITTQLNAVALILINVRNGAGVGTVTSVGFAAPTGFVVTNSPVVGAGTLTLAMPTGWTTGDLLLGNGANSVTRLPIGSNNFAVLSNGSTAAWGAISDAILPADRGLRTCMIVAGADNGGALADADIAPQLQECKIPVAGTLVEIDVSSNAGTPTAIIAKRHCTVSPCVTGANETVSDLVSSSLAAGTSGATACSKVGATAGVDTFTTCLATLQNTALAAGDFIETRTATAGGVAVKYTISVFWTVP